MPSNDELRDYYHSYEGNKTYISKTEKKIRRAKKRIVRWMGLAPGRTFLDVGCNAGFAVEAAYRLSLQATGIDLGEDAIIVAKKLFPHNDFRVAGPVDLAQTGRRFDFIYCSEVIEHTNGPDAFVNALHELMTTRGLLYLTTPDAGHLRVPKNFIDWQSVHPPSHLCYFSKSNIRQLLANHNIEVIKFLWNIKSGIKTIARRID
jgi:2-polyprenyl-3-methyl-5-hydroxy-6-metoxy-1,4-benzoquinol methylase